MEFVEGEPFVSWQTPCAPDQIELGVLAFFGKYWGKIYIDKWSNIAVLQWENFQKERAALQMVSTCKAPALGFAAREAGGGKWGLVLAVSSLCKPPTTKGVKLLRCCSLVAWKWHGKHARNPCWSSLAVFEILFHALPAVSTHQLIAAATFCSGVCAPCRPVGWDVGGKPRRPKCNFKTLNLTSRGWPCSLLSEWE